MPAQQPGDALVAGVDEVGRGALFGPVVAAAVVLPASASGELVRAGVRDSKQLSAQRRQALVPTIGNVARDWAVASASAREIDRLNVRQAARLAMGRAVDALAVRPQACWIDGREQLPELALPQRNWIRGDARVAAIAAASIVAKVWRDERIAQQAPTYPAYDLAANKGYGTRRHRQALQRYGPSDQHRRSFRPCQQAPAASHRD